MNKFILFFVSITLACVVFSCEKKSSSSSSTTSTSSVASPSINTSVSIGGPNPGWSYAGCATSPNSFTAYYTNTIAKLVFGSPWSLLTTGTYTFTSGTPTVGQAQLILNDPPGQPSGYIWYSNSSQTLSIYCSPGNTIAIFNNIACAQSTSSTPIVTASGTLTCP